MSKLTRKASRLLGLVIGPEHFTISQCSTHMMLLHKETQTPQIEDRTGDSSFDLSASASSAICSGSLDFVQLRAPGHDTSQIKKMGKVLKDRISQRKPPLREHQNTKTSVEERFAATLPSHPLLLINGDIDAFISIQADGLHLPERLWKAPDFNLEKIVDSVLQDWNRGNSSLSAAALSRSEEQPYNRSSIVIGGAAHSLEDALTLARMGVDYVQLGTMYPTSSHPDKVVLEGIPLLQDVVAALRQKKEENQDNMIDSKHADWHGKLLCIGGIELSNVDEVLNNGADGVAVISAILKAQDPATGARKLAERIKAQY